MFTNPETFYNESVQLLKEQLQKINQQANLLVFLRLLTFLIILSGVVLLTILKIRAIAILIIIFGLASFIYFITLHIKKKTEKNLKEELLKINENELKLLKFQFTEIMSSDEHNLPSHPYANDLNIFGYASLFQYINRCATIFGREKLEHKLLNSCTDKELIKAKQDACAEMSRKPQWRQMFQACGALVETNQSEIKGLLNWLQEPSQLIYNRLLKWSITILPVVSFVFLVYGFITDFYAFAKIFYILQVFILLIYAHKIKVIHEQLSNRFRLLECYSQLFALIEKEEFNSTYLSTLKKDISGNESGTSIQLKKLAKILEMFDRRLNFLAAIVLNGLYMSDIRAVLQLEKWKEHNRELLPKWLNALAEFDSMASLSNMAFNNPDYCYPKMSENKILAANEMGHPLIPSDKRVSNDFEISSEGQFVILTGANMAGKSTFLRTVGVNMVLAMNGAPVCAKKFEFKPIPILTIISVKDSLADNESYFYAELKRLRMIIDELEAGNTIFIILDEILKGTNSADKLKGSRSLMQKLTTYKAAGIVATHDIALGELENTFPNNIFNNCFEVQLADDMLYYDYKLHKGVCKNLNASFLMKKMGIIN